MKEPVEHSAHTEVPADAHGAEPFHHDPTFWVAMGFIGFVFVFVRYALNPITAMLDARAAKIKDQLEQAARLKEEAEALLKEYDKKKKAAAKEAKAIIDTAKQDAADLRIRAMEELEASLARRTQQAQEKIARAEADATRAIKEQIVMMATDVARDVVSAELDGRKEDPAVARTLEAIHSQLH
jgi:F-type H+-transporting ATPase subunit b